MGFKETYYAEFDNGKINLDLIRNGCPSTVVNQYYNQWMREHHIDPNWRIKLTEVTIKGMYFKKIPIDGFDNYLISKDGTIWGLRNWNYLAPAKDKDGYLFYGLHNKLKDNKKCPIRVQKLVMLTYGPPCPQELIDNDDVSIDHINHDKLDNRVENLRWLSKRENGSNKYKAKINIYGNDCRKDSKNDYDNIRILANDLENGLFPEEAYIKYQDILSHDTINEVINKSAFNSILYDKTYNFTNPDSDAIKRATKAFNYSFRNGEYIKNFKESIKIFGTSIIAFRIILHAFINNVDENTCSSIDDIGKNEDLPGYGSWKDSI